MTIATDRFDVEHQIGAGAMGTVYRARDRESGEIVALKILRTRDPADAERFAREVSVLANLEHPAIVRYVAHGETDEGDPYLAMEWLEGEDLSERLRRGRLVVNDAVRLGVRVAGGLSVAHARGVVHRDIKPSNLYLPSGDIERVKLLDFGVARWRQTAQMPTLTGTVLGTPAYMAPEQARGERQIGPEADIFALGCVLFECLTGRTPFAAKHALLMLTKLLYEEPPRLRQACDDVPLSVARVVERMMAKDPKRRFANGGELYDDLTQLASNNETPSENRPNSSKPRRRTSLPPPLETLRSGPAGRDTEYKSVEIIIAPPMPRTPPPPPPPLPPGALLSNTTLVQGPNAFWSSLGAAREKPAQLGPMSNMVFEVLAKHVPLPWAVMQSQCQRLGKDPFNLEVGDLPALAESLVVAVARFMTPVRQAALIEEIRALEEVALEPPPTGSRSADAQSMDAQAADSNPADPYAMESPPTVPSGAKPSALQVSAIKPLSGDPATDEPDTPATLR